MNDQNNQSNPSDTAVADQNISQSAPPVAPAVSEPPTEPAAPPAPPVAPAVPEKDLQDLSKNLEQLSQEAAKAPTAEPAVAQPEAPEPPAEPAAPQEPATSEPVSQPASEPAVEEKNQSTEPIVVYATAKCPFCQTEKDYLKEQGLNFVEKNVEEDNEALKEMLNLSNNFAGVPVTVLNGPKGKKVVKGFTKEEFVKTLQEVGLKEEAVAEPTTETEAPKPVEEPKVPDLK